MFAEEDNNNSQNQAKVLNHYSNSSEPMVDSNPETVDSPDEANNEISNVEF